MTTYFWNALIKILVTISIVCVWNDKSVAQNYLLDDSTSAYFLQGNVGNQNVSIYSNGFVGYRINGRLDISFIGGYSKLQKFAKFYLIGPSFEYLLIQQGKVPLSVS